MKKVTVHVPATTANLGPGFDVLGMALDLWNHAIFEPAEDVTRVQIQGYGADELPGNKTNLVALSARRLFREVGHSSMDVKISCQNEFPLGSGLGSSSAAIVTGLVGANMMLNEPLSDEEVMVLATEIEGHPDNVAPALFGGLTISISQPDETVLTRKYSAARWWVAVNVPGVELSTAESRAVMPESISMADAVFNMGRIPLVVEAFRTDNMPLLRNALQDKLHQPYRLKLIPGARQAVETAFKMGSAAALSGAGPGVIAFAQSEAAAQKLSSAMKKCFDRRGIPTWSWAGQVSERGAWGE
jgi:homoserine kinase